VRFVLSDSLPADLSLCGAIFIVGGFGAGGVNLDSSELARLMSFMDAGRDVYLESTRLGEWIDPGQGNPSPEEAAFFGYFGCSFLPGDSAAAGNVASWSTKANVLPNVFSFDYDYKGAPDDRVGTLVPDPSSDTLIVDQAGKVRGVVSHGPNNSTRIYATVMLGGSTGQGASNREDFLRGVLDLFDTIVPALAVARMDYSSRAGRVTINGEIEGYDSEVLAMTAENLDDRALHEVPLKITPSGRRAFVAAEDAPGDGTYRYRIEVRRREGSSLLWQQDITVSSGPPRLAISAIYPNPASGAFSFHIESPGAEPAEIAVFDPSGRKVYRARARLREGGNVIPWEAVDNGGRYLSSGVYFLRVRAGGETARAKLVLIR